MLILSALAMAADFTDSFDDDVYDWTTRTGTWREEGGQLIGSQDAAGPGALIDVGFTDPLASAVFTVNFDPSEDQVGVVWMSTETEYCGVVAGGGGVWTSDSRDGEVIAFEGLVGNLPGELQVTVTPSSVRVEFQGMFLFERADACSITSPSGLVGVLTLSNSSEVAISDFSVTIGARDSDGDGSADDEDCAPDDPAISPNAEEVWYDGADQNCDGADDYDADYDGYTSDDHGGDDCDDDDDDSYPGAVDIFYDGIDSDCAGNDDFDADGDGYAVEEDCDDGDNTAYPGSTADESDGQDRDCDGFIPNPDYEPDTGEAADSGGEGNAKDKEEPRSSCATTSPLPAMGLILGALATLARRRR